ncbi:hypothetical protein ACSV4D_15190 [Flavobacterium sp. ARAG 55.4]|uniref:Uncharacterized protein n=1 Tax=Flavobacterium plantiphilum TaxID=3163297 RepID=A0ABW8XUH5_9FLAO
MEQIKVIFFALASFFGIEDSRIAADKTTITIYPEKKEIEIIQEGLFSIVQTEKDSVLILEEWNKLSELKKGHTNWSGELDSFTMKSFDFTPVKNAIQPHLILKYSNEKDLRNLGIWYDENKNQFSVNHNEQDNLTTSDGNLEGNYWVFNGDHKFSFTLAPFLQMPENYLKFKRPLKELISSVKKQ